MELKPLRECIKTCSNKVRLREYDNASTDTLLGLIISCDSKLLTEREDSRRVDNLRAINWYVNAALSRRGLAPSARACLGTIRRKPERLLHQITKEDAPYIDLQWIGFQHPDHVPTKWIGIRRLTATAPGTICPSTTSSSIEDNIIFGETEPAEVIDNAFDAADRLVHGQASISRKCLAMKLAPAIQAELRWLCSERVRKMLKEIACHEQELRHKMEAQGIKQLTKEMIDNRLRIFRAWKLAGGGTNWQAAANTFIAMTGKKITRQAIKDMITRMGDQKIIRRRKGKKKIIESALPLK